MRRNHRITLRGLPLWAAALGAVALLTPPPGSADTPGKHPHYMNARSALRRAQLLLQVRDEPNVMSHVHAVDGEIDAAIREIDHAAVLDRKDVDDHPRFDTRLDRPGRFRRAMALLNSARKEIGLEEDNPRAIGWRDVAFRHIDGAMEQLRKAARDLRMDHLEGF